MLLWEGFGWLFFFALNEITCVTVFNPLQCTNLAILYLTDGIKFPACCNHLLELSFERPWGFTWNILASSFLKIAVNMCSKYSGTSYSEESVYDNVSSFHSTKMWPSPQFQSIMTDLCLWSCWWISHYLISFNLLPKWLFPVTFLPHAENPTFF